MPVIELIESRVYGVESGNRRMGVQVFLVKMKPQAAIEALRISVDQSTHPDDGDLLCRGIHPEIIEGSPGYSKVTVRYDNFPPSIGPAVNPSDPFFRSWSFDFQHRQIVLPRAEAKTLTSGGPDGAVIHSVRELNTDLEPLHTFTVLTRRTVLTSMSPELINHLGSLSNTLQNIHGRWYKLTVGQGDEFEPGRWSVNYTFENDPGTPNLWPTVNPFADFLYPHGLTGAYSTGVFARPPFHFLEARRVATSSTNWTIEFDARPQYAAPMPNAWEALPGMT